MNDTKTRSERFWERITKIRNISANFLFLLIVSVLLIAVVGSFFSGDLKDPKGKALVLNPQGPIVEQLQGTGDPFDLILQGQPQKEVLARHFLEILDYAAKDDRIKFVVLELDNIYGTGQVVLFDIGKALEKIKEAGKTIISTADSYDESAYYLASFSNEVIMNPDGFIFLEGYSRYRTYYKSLLNKLKISVNLFRVGKFKSAMEPFIRDNMSEEAKEANKKWMGVLWESWKREVAENRNLLPADIQKFADNAQNYVKEESGDTATALLKANLIDKVMNRTATRKYLNDLIGKEKDEESFPQISGQEYLQVISSEKETFSSKDEIAIIVAQGTILDGEQPSGMIGGDSTATIIRKAHQNENIKAIVLRVDSGGGSAFASEVIREEIVNARSKGIPVIASMSNVAASGGYWISASANEIWASHNTITGSIGIFGFFPTFEKTLNEIGIHTDGISTTKLGPMDPTMELNPALADILQSTIEFGYQRFIGLVSEERKMSKEKVDVIAQGRVWSGETANEIGLVDKIGDLQQAVLRAAELAGVEKYKTSYPSEELDWKQQILKQLFSFVSFFPPGFNDNPVFKKSVNLFEEIENFNDPRGVYAICLDCYIY